MSQLVRAGVIMEEDDPGLPRLGDAATGALVQLLLVSVVLAFFLSMTSGNPLPELTSCLAGGMGSKVPRSGSRHCSLGRQHAST